MPTAVNKIQKLLRNFRIVQKLALCEQNKYLKEYKLTPPQIHILYLIHHQTNITVKDIANYLGISSSAATQIIDNLEKNNFILREINSKDRRITHLKISKEGLSKFKKFKTEHLSKVQKYFQDLTEEELDFLINITQKIIQNNT